MQIFKIVMAFALFLGATHSAQAQGKRTRVDGTKSEQVADVLSGTLGAASGFGRGRWTSGVGYAGSAVPIVFALGHQADVAAYCERVRTRAHARECTRLQKEADERLGMSILYATPLGDVKEIAEGLEKGDPKRVICGGIGLAGLASPARAVSVAGGVCSVLDVTEALSRGASRYPTSSRPVVVFHQDHP